MSDEKKTSSDLLSSLLAEQKQIAAAEKKDIEDRLRAKEDQERMRKEQEAQRQRELLQQRLEEEKKRADERFRKRQERLRAEADPERKAEGAAAQPIAPVVAVAPPAKKFPLAPVLALAAVVVIGGAVGLILLLTQDSGPQKMLVRKQAVAALAAVDSRADTLLVDWQHEVERTRKDAEQERERQEQIENLRKQLQTKTEQGGAEAEALKKQIEALRAQQEEAKAGNGHKGVKKNGDGGDGGLQIDNCALGGKNCKKIVK